MRPGGLVCFITSSHTMDAQYDAVREFIASQAHLLGAIRLAVVSGPQVAAMLPGTTQRLALPQEAP